MQYQAILFDLDGTLLPMDIKEFMFGYFRYLGKRLEPYDIPYEAMVRAILKGTEAMARNNGTVTNRKVFWKTFGDCLGLTEERCSEIDSECNDFYVKEFQAAKQFTGENPFAREMVSVAREKASIVCLASNPVFPMNGHITRLGWVGLKTSDFDLVTAYEDWYYSKPNPQYYLEISRKLGVRPEECLMIGNDEKEDMQAAKAAGMSAWLINDWSIPNKEQPWTGIRGSFLETLERLREL